MSGTGPASDDASPSADAPPVSDPLDSPTGTRSASDRPAGAGKSEQASQLKLGKDQTREMARGLVFTGAAWLHNTLARSDWERDQGLWLITEESEAAAIADPLASIAQRRAGGAVVEPDMADLINAGLAAGGYLLKHGWRAVQYRLAVRRALRASVTPDTEQHEEQAA